MGSALAFLAAFWSTENQSYFILSSKTSTSSKLYCAQASPGGILSTFSTVPFEPSNVKKSCHPPECEHLYSKAVLFTYIVPLFWENKVYA